MVYALVLVPAILMIVGTALIFVLKDTMHAAVSLAFIFILNSLIFLMLDQPLLALIQLFIMVGGVSVYLFVGVASSSYSNFKHTNYFLFAGIAIVLFAITAYGAYSSNAFQSYQLTNSFGISEASAAFSMSSTIISLYAITFMLFILALGSLPLLNRLRVT